MESKTLNNINQIMTIIISVSCLSLFLRFYDNSMEYDIDITPAIEQGGTDNLVKEEYLIYSVNPGNFEIITQYRGTLLSYVKRQEIQANRDLFVDRNIDAKVLTVTAEYSDGRSEHVDIYLHQFIELSNWSSDDAPKYRWVDSSHAFKMSAPPEL